MTAREPRAGRAVLAAAVLLGSCALTLAATAAARETQGGAKKPGTGGVKLTKLAAGLDQPVHVAAAPSLRRNLYVVERGGRVLVIRDGATRETPLFDISDSVESGNSEQGLLSIAFHPHFERNHLAYVYFNQLDTDNLVAEIRTDPKGLRAIGEPRAVLEIPHRDDFPNHNAGALQFGPDGLLYVSVGDGAESEQAQSHDSLLGKILRIDPRRRGSEPYTVPTGNPFAQGPGRDEIYALGFRNPWRFSFDRLKGAIAIGDVGSDAPIAREEVNFRKRGKARGSNFGWPRFEGKALIDPDLAAPGAVAPILAYPHHGTCAISGGYVARDKRLPSLLGRYLYADFCSGQIRSLIPSQGSASDDRPLGVRSLQSVSSFGEDAKGRLMLTTLNGSLRRLDPK